MATIFRGPLGPAVDTPPPGSGPSTTYEPGGCQGAGAIDHPPPVGVQVQTRPSVGNATSVPNSPVQFGTLGQVPSYAQPQEWAAPPQVPPPYIPPMHKPQVHPHVPVQAQVPGVSQGHPSCLCSLHSEWLLHRRIQRIHQWCRHMCKQRMQLWCRHLQHRGQGHLPVCVRL